MRTNSISESPSDSRLSPVAAPDRLAARLRGFGVVGLFALVGIYLGSVLIPGLGALLVLLWAWRSRTLWDEIGLARPESWMATIALGVVLGVALRLLMKFAVMPLLGAPAVNQAFQYLAGNSAALPAAIFMMGFVAAFTEEVVMRGFLFERLTRLLGRGKASLLFIVLATSFVFGIGHYPLQGLAGAQNATLMGLVFGTLYVITGRVWLPVVVHATFNIAGVMMIYLRL